MEVLNVHRRPPLSDRGSLLRGYLPSREVRRQEIAAFTEALEPGVTALVVGTYYRKVVAADGDGGKGSSETGRFTTR